MELPGHEAPAPSNAQFQSGFGDDVEENGAHSSPAFLGIQRGHAGFRRRGFPFPAKGLAELMISLPWGGRTSGESSLNPNNTQVRRNQIKT